MLKRKDLIEIGRLTEKTNKEFGCSMEQIFFINELLFEIDDKTHGYVLDNLFSDGIHMSRYRITVTDAQKLINSLVNKTGFEFVYYDTDKWHLYKKQERFLQKSLHM